MVRPTGQLVAAAALLSGLLVLLPSSVAEAQLPPTRSSAQSAVGFQGGASIDPEQVFAGVFWQSPSIGGRFYLRPGIDGGFVVLRAPDVRGEFSVRRSLAAGALAVTVNGSPIRTHAGAYVGKAHERSHLQNINDRLSQASATRAVVCKP